MSLAATIPVRRALWIAAIIFMIGAILYPSDMDGHYTASRGGHNDKLVVSIEEYGRHLNTALPLVTAILLRDVTGLRQIATIALAGTAATHIPKRALNDIEIAGTRLGQRPNGGNHNMPSGHSALASAGAYFTVRRYSQWLGLIVWPVTIMTMYARYMLDAHTVSATIAGAIIGILVAAAFATPLVGFKRRVIRLGHVTMGPLAQRKRPRLRLPYKTVNLLKGT